MKSQAILSIGMFLFASPFASAQAQAPPAAPLPPDALHSLQSMADPKEPAILATCKNPPPAPQRPPGPPPGTAPAPGPRDYNVPEIPGVIAAGQKWNFVWQQLGNNGDGIIASRDGGLLICAERQQCRGEARQGRPRNSGLHRHEHGWCAFDELERRSFYRRAGCESRRSFELALNHRTLADQFQGQPWDCIGIVLNDLSADSKGGAYFTMGSVYYAAPDGQVTKYGPDLHTNGIILSTDEKTLYVTNNTTVVAFDVSPNGSLTNQRDFGKRALGEAADMAMDRRLTPPKPTLRHHGSGRAGARPRWKVPRPDSDTTARYQRGVLGERQEDTLHPRPWRKRSSRK